MITNFIPHLKELEVHLVKNCHLQYKGEWEKTVDTGEATFGLSFFKNDRSWQVKLEYFVSEQK